MTSFTVKNKHRHHSEFLIILYLLVTSLPAFAYDLSSQQLSTPTAAGGAAEQPAERLKGAVQKVELSLETLEDISLDLKHLLTASRHLYDEVNIQPVTFQTMPEMVGPGAIIYIPVPGSAHPIGQSAPPRKQRLDLAMSEITPIISMLKLDVDSFLTGQKQLDLSPDLHQELSPIFKEWVSSVNDLSQQLISLEKLTAGPTYNNTFISQSANSIQGDCRALQKNVKHIFKALQKEGKKHK